LWAVRVETRESLIFGSAHDPAYGIAGKAAILQETHLFGTLCRTVRQITEFSRPYGAAAHHFVATFRQGSQNIIIADAALPQFLLQAGIAVTAGARDDALAGVTLVGEQTLGLQPIKHRCQLFFGFRLRGELALQLGPAMVTPGE